jgi:putative ABC transport system ATP-binding protein
MTSLSLRMRGVTKTYGAGAGEVKALDDLSLDLESGAFTAVMGPSGSGKSTLLQCAAGLDRPSAGTVELAGTDITDLDEPALTELRRERVGFVFQHFNLLPALTALDNVALPLRLAGRPVDPARCRTALDRVGLGDRAHHRPAELSGGQQQRVAIARAIVTAPDTVFADEPTGALDSRSARRILELLRAVADEARRTVVLVTHDPVAAAYADAVVFLTDGRIAGWLQDPTVERVAERLACLGEAVGA